MGHLGEGHGAPLIKVDPATPLPQMAEILGGSRGITPLVRGVWGEQRFPR